jgi:hypothetical protein
MLLYASCVSKTPVLLDARQQNTSKHMFTSRILIVTAIGILKTKKQTSQPEKPVTTPPMRH